MNTQAIKRPAPGVCWTFHPSEAPEDFWSLFDGHVSASPYTTPRWSLFWEKTFTHAASELWIVGLHSGGVFALCVTRRHRLGWDWAFCQPHGTTGLFSTTQYDSRDHELLGDVLRQVAGRRCPQITLNGAVPSVGLQGWRLSKNSYESWVLDALGTNSDSFLNDISDNHRRNIDKGEKTRAELTMIHSPSEVVRMQSHMESTRAGDSRLVLDPKLGPLFAETFGDSRDSRWYSAWHQNHCAATSLWLIRGNHAVYVDGASDMRTASSGISHYLFFHALTDLFGTGVRFFDFGAGPGGKSSQGLIRFKEGWGARPDSREELVLRKPFYHMLRRIV